MLMLRPLSKSLMSVSLLAACAQAQFSGSTGSKNAREDAPAPTDSAPVVATATATATDTVTPPTATTVTNATDTATSPATSPSTATSPATTTSPSTVTSPSTSTSTSQQPPAGVCLPTQQAIGTQIAFLIDNSNSNAATDCPNMTWIGQFNGAGLYRCASPTARQNAVMAAYDVLAQIQASEPGNALAQSTLAVASFPSRQDYISGWSLATNGWVSVAAQGREQVVNALAFTTTPMGLTPYGAAFTAATQLFASSATDARSKVAVLVTDGDPTDRDPAAVQAQADALKASGVKVIVVTYNATRASRAQAEISDLKAIDDAYVKATGGHWYASHYPTFDAYISALIGTSGQAGLAQTVSSSGQLIEVEDAANLRSTFLNIINHQAIACQ